MGIEPIQPMEEPVAPPGIRRALIGTGAVSVIGVLVGLVTSSLLARSLGPEGRGQYSAVLNWPNFIAMMGLAGIHSAVTYYSAVDPQRALAWRANSLWLVLLGWTGSSAACWLLMPYLLRAQSTSTIADARLFGVVYGLGMATWSVGVGSLQGLRAFKEWNLLRSFQMFLWLLLLAGYVLWNVQSVRLLSVTFGATFLVLAPAAYAIKRDNGSWFPDRTLARHLIGYGLPSLLASLPGQLNRRLDQLMMATLVPPRVLGLYAVAVTLAIPLSVISVPVANVIMPNIASATTIAQKAELLGRVTRATTLVLLLAGVGIMAIVPAFVPLVFGDAFRPAIAPAMILVAASVLLGLVTVLEDSLMGLGCPRSVLKAETCGFAVTIVGLAITLGRWPLIGAALVSLLAYTLTLWIILRECHQVIRLPARDLLKPGRIEWALLVTWLVGCGQWLRGFFSSSHPNRE